MPPGDGGTVGSGLRDRYGLTGDIHCGVSRVARVTDGLTVTIPSRCCLTSPRPTLRSSLSPTDIPRRGDADRNRAACRIEGE